LKKKILPSKFTKIHFVARGDFITCITELIPIESSALKPGKSTVFRTSRFALNDFQSSIQEDYPEQKVLFAKNINSKIYQGEYINRSQIFDQRALEVFMEILGHDSSKEDFFIIRLEHKGISVYKINKQGECEKVSEKYFSYPEYSQNLNNLIFDPCSDLHGKNPDTEYIKLFKDATASLNKFKSLNVLMVGEFIWSNDMSVLVEEILKNKNLGKAQIFIDKNGLVEALLSEAGYTTILGYLYKSFFIPDIFYTSEIPVNRRIKVYSDRGEREVLLFEDRMNVVPIKENELIDLYDFKEKRAFIIIGKGKITEEKGFLEKLEEKLQIARKDIFFEYVDGEILFERNIGKRLSIKIFDYSELENTKNLKLDVVDGERVKIGQKLCSYSKFGSVLEKRVVSTINGQIDLSKVNFGYIIVSEKKRKAIKIKNQAYIHIRARHVFGSNVDGLLDEDIKYVPNIDKDGYEKFIQKGYKAIITRRIEKRLFLDVLEFKLENLVALVLLEGIEIPIGENVPFIFDELRHFNVSINSETKSVDVGLPKKRGNFYSSRGLNGSAYPGFKPRTTYKINEKIRVIDRVNWGDYAKIIDINTNKVKLKHKKGISQLDIINII